MIKNKKVLVALSGGADSSAAAFLLKKKGYDVSAVFMRFWKEKETKEENKCCSVELEMRAKKVCQKLKIPFYIYNFKREFKKAVVDNFLGAYKKGLTPNPCVVCNEKVKIGLLLKKARAIGFDFLATGHYARLWKDKDGWHLGTARDSKKDQAYFLHRLNQKDLKHLLMPLGDFLKSDVKKIIKKNKIPAKTAIESQEICFVPADDIVGFLKRQIKVKKGKIVDSSGKTIGGHIGLPLYTLGQRKGLGLSGGPFYVLKKDLRKNKLIVTKNKKELYSREFFVALSSPLHAKDWTAPLLIKTRSTDKFRKGRVILQSKNKTKVILEKPVFAPTPGQSTVFYRNTRANKKEVLGGGMILANNPLTIRFSH